MTALCLDLKLARTLKLFLSGGADMGAAALESKVGLITLGGGGGALVEVGSVTDDATENCNSFSLVTQIVLF